MTDSTESIPGRRTTISRDPIGIDPIGNDPLDFSDAPPRKDEGPNRTVGGWTANATAFFSAVVVLGVVMVLAIIVFALRT